MPEGCESVPSLAYREGLRLAEAYPAPNEISQRRGELLQRIEEDVFGGFPREFRPVVEAEPDAPSNGILVTTEPGICVPIEIRGAATGPSCLLRIASPDSADAPSPKRRALAGCRIMKTSNGLGWTSRATNLRVCKPLTIWHGAPK